MKLQLNELTLNVANGDNVTLFEVHKVVHDDFIYAMLIPLKALSNFEV